MSEDLTQKSLESVNLNSLLDSSVDVIIQFSPDGIVQFVSAASNKIIGYDSSELYKKSIFDIIHEDKVEVFKLQINEILQSEIPVSFMSELINSKNENIVIELTLRKTEIDGNTFIQGTIRDIRLRIETQRKLFSSENIFITIWENTKDGMRLTDQDGNVVLCNKAFANLFGKSTDEIINRPISDLYAAERSEEIINN
jgi:PAS domain S-box-containing protein